MAIQLTINDPTDPGVQVNAYTRLVLIAKSRKGLNQGLHAEFLAYRSQNAANMGGTAIQGITLDVDANVYNLAYDYVFSPEAMSQPGWNLEAAVYAFGSRFYPALADAEPVLDEGQVPLMLDIPEQVADQIRAMLQPQQ